MTVFSLKNISAFSIVGLLMLITGCAHLSVSHTPEELVAKRAEARLNALLSKDFDKAYSFSSPGLREKMSARLFRARHAGVHGWVGGEVRGVKCHREELCDVDVAVTYQAMFGPHSRASDIAKGPMVNTRVFTEHWLYVEGQWWFVEAR